MKSISKNFIVLFIIVSIVIISIIANFQLGVLRVPLILTHLIIFFLLSLRSFKFDLYVRLNILFFVYVIVQSLFIQFDLTLLLFIQASISIQLYLFFYFSCINKAENLFDDKLLIRTSNYIICLIPFLLISLVDWNVFRTAGILGNPNLTSHTLATILPFTLMVKRKNSLYIVLCFFVLISLYYYASRSALLAIIFGVIGYIISLKFHKKKTLFYFFYVVLVIYLSYSIVDLLIDFLTLYGQYFDGVDSRLLYTGYNGRDILFEQAFDRFEGNELFGLGFDGAKFEIGYDHVLSTHNGFLEILLRLGYGGMIIFGAILFYMLWKISQVKEKYTRSAAFMSFIIIMSLSTNSSTFYVFNYYFYYLILIYCIAVFNKINNGSN